MQVLRLDAGLTLQDNLARTKNGIPLNGTLADLDACRSVLGVLLATYLVRVFTSDLFVLDLHIAGATYGLAVAGGLLPALVAAWPNLRGIARIDLGKAVRERAR